MKRRILPSALSLLTAFASAVSAQDYATLLSNGDAALAKQDYPAALVEYTKAEEISTSPGERSFAVAKQALVKSEQKDYPAAGSLAKQALENKEISSVCEVTALQALGLYQMKGERDFAAAAESFERAAQLRDVDWARPYLNLLLGDCLRETGQSSEALEAYDRVINLPNSNDSLKSSAYFNIGLEQVYRLKDATKARAAFDEAAKLNPALRAEADKHLAALP
jgi:tetratricopeptide (TPR) repeat protein